MIVEPLKGFWILCDLISHYESVGGKVTAGSTEDTAFIVRIPSKNVIHFYQYNRGFTGPSYLFKSEGHYDEHSPLWRE